MRAVLEEKKVVLDVRELTRSFGQIRALDNVSFSVQQGRSLVIIGGSGSGKTLLLKAILGVVDVDSGQILVDGQDMTGRARDNEDFLDRFGMLFQQSALFDSMPVWRNIAFKILKGHGADEVAIKEKAIEALGRVGLRVEVADLYPSELSGGMQKRVGLARAFAGRPEFLFLDEPTAGLDPIMSNSISELIVDMKQDKNVTCMIVSSDLASVRKISDDVLMLHEGRVVWSGPTKELDTTDNPYVQQFINKSAVGPIAVMTE
ncbi:ATP-binding cassette domain-containing protein [Kiloniella laminariae]|uniref:ATP-binding cassette domain-containing protein n=1 Tax=Kiloniella laminariae TaxID=454162 RepID=A0ABT4LG95_9PROT|nr:ATP-binding cassette domain-containing protein [Kiloniella laminariae]MCZ4280124.1 ATP-binding cassette domain-containing protein [Kiloniella laminariae]